MSVRDGLKNMFLFLKAFRRNPEERFDNADQMLKAWREAGSRALALLADDVDIAVAQPTTNVVIRGASALLVARELGLSLVR